MSIAADVAPRSRMIGNPSIVLLLVGATVVLVAGLLSLPIRLPVGPMYWDVIVYYDAAQRIFEGQIPIVDFFAPVGPLGYYLFAAFAAIFPNAQPILIAHWSLLPVTLPLMALVSIHVARRSPPIALALLIPFMIFALLPFNTREFYSYPGSDGFGIYNRQVCQVLYVLVAALLFSRSARLTALVIATTVTALFFLKITGFVAALVIAGYGFLAGRIAFRGALAAAVVFLAILLVLEASLGMISIYLADILALVDKNSGSLAPRFLQAASHTFGIIGPCLALIALLLWSTRNDVSTRLVAMRTRFSLREASGLLDHNALWLGVVIFAGILFETQNTGSQAMIFLWPILLAILLRTGKMMNRPKMLIAVLALIAAAYLPIVVNTTERAARAWFGAVKNLPLENTNLGVLGQLNMRQDVKERAEKLRDFYPAHREAFEDLVRIGELPSFVQYSDFDFQILHLMAIDDAVSAVRALETDGKIRFDTIMAINFVNPFPWLLDRDAPLHLAIGADPTRAVPAPDAAVLEAVRNVDLALYPKCPPTTSNARLWALYGTALEGHRRISLTACYDAYVSPRIAERLAR